MFLITPAYDHWLVAVQERLSFYQDYHVTDESASGTKQAI